MSTQHSMISNACSKATVQAALSPTCQRCVGQEPRRALVCMPNRRCCFRLCRNRALSFGARYTMHTLKPQGKPLAEVADQQIYRKRGPDEHEIVTNQQIDGRQPTRFCGLLSSARTKDLARIRFHNASQQHVRALWIDFDGHEVSISKVQLVHSWAYTPAAQLVACVL